MRLWHKDLIPVLPQQQLMGQWRECCLIAKLIAQNGTPNHILVNKVMHYPLEHLLRYGELVQLEMRKRGYKADLSKFVPYLQATDCDFANIVTKEDLFQGWHNGRYLKQCYYNLQEKFDCGGIRPKEWAKVVRFMPDPL